MTKQALRHHKIGCSSCHADVTLNGGQLCNICDPVIMDVLRGIKQRVSPILCGKCFKDHVIAHETSKTKPPYKFVP
jgi:hypothetical protein